MTVPDPIIAHYLNRRRQYSALTQHGLPIIDGIYWDQPSPGVAGLFLIVRGEPVACAAGSTQ
jgi:hypothetical protein